VSYLIGVLLAIVVVLLGAAGGFDRDRSFYPTLLMAIASYYVLFAAIAGSTNAIATEAVVMAVFVALAISSVRRNLWFAVVGLAAHGVFDSFHAVLAPSTGAPTWWPAFCLAFDVTAAAYVAWLLAFGRGPPARPLPR
jgi:hypothetical protein